MVEDYRRARKAAQKEYARDVAAGRYPYPPALDDVLKGIGFAGTVPVGTMDIDLTLVAGTRTRGRQNTFSRSFMPLPEEDTEFALKWMDLMRAQREEGIREPILAYEYLQRFYVQEGNKRVSVLRYLGQPQVTAQVIRIVPMHGDDIALRVYREFMGFFAVAPVYGIVFSEEGGYARLAALAGEDFDHPWSAEHVRALRQSFQAFKNVFCARGGTELGITPGDAYLEYLKVFGFDTVAVWSPSQVGRGVERVWSEFSVASGQGGVAYLESPAPPASGTEKIPPKIRGIYHAVVDRKPFRISYIYDRTSYTSGWTLMHERGRLRLQELMPGAVETRCYAGCDTEEAFDRAVASAIEAESDLVVTIAPTQMTSTLRAAVAHPAHKFINCSVSIGASAVRTFAVRMYEAKFLLGALAASVSDNHRLGYVATSPVFGTIAEINAFAVGAAMVDAQAEIHLKWYAAKDYDWRRELAEEGVRVVCARDCADPLDGTAPWGLYRVEADGSTRQLARPVMKWGHYYAEIVRSIQDDAWRREASARRNQALNYWWGISSGVLDVKLAQGLARGQRDLVDLLRQGLLAGFIHPFAGELRSQTGEIQPAEAPRLHSADIARMDWLCDNVIGRLPFEQELDEDSFEQVAVSGVIPVDPLKAARIEVGQ